MAGFLTAEVMSGRDWAATERAVARLMTQRGWKDVRVVGRPGDKGGDVVGIFPKPPGTADEVFAVQVKSVSAGNMVGTGSVQEVLAAQSEYSADVAVVATNGEFREAAYSRKEQLTSEGYRIHLWNGAFLTKLLEVSPYDSPRRPVALYPYQEEVLSGLMASFVSDAPKALFTMATGLGKTVVAGEFIRQLLDQGEVSRVLVIAHSTELVRQLEESLWRHLGKDTPTRLVAGGSSIGDTHGVTVALWQSLVGLLPSLASYEFDLVVVDEAHNALGSVYRQCVEQLKPKFLLGMTATPWRMDGQSLEALFGDPVASVSIVQGMKQGYLARVDYRLLADDIDWDRVPAISKKGLGIRDLNRRLFLPQRDEASVQAVIEQCAHVPNPRIIVFAERIEHGQRIADLFNAETPLRAACVSGAPAVFVQRALMEFSTGKIQVIIAVDLLNEGIDVPEVNVIVFMRRTNSRRVFVQQLGRGLRTNPRNQKTVLVLDLVSDLTRVSAMMEMRGQDERSSGAESLILPVTEVRFASQQQSEFFLEWIADMASLGDDEARREFEYPI